MRIKTLGVLMAAGLVLGGCAHVRVVKKQPGKGGELAINRGIFGDADKDANAAMRANCGKKKPVVTEEGEAVVGSTSYSDTQKDKKRGSTSTSSSTRDETEWRIKYSCK